ncbi:MAG: TRAP transporter small permease subunit [Syntrophobacterales bacterium]|nr:MAG: TRAP transporter small permease subunit [Syntrophobacterales bacterium]
MIRGPGGFSKRGLLLFSKLEYLVLVFLLAVMVGLAFLQIFLRIFFATGILWIDPLLRHLVLWIALLGAAIAAKEGRHINIEVISRVLPDRGRVAIQALTDFFSTVICLLLIQASLKFIRDELQAGTLAFVKIPTWAVLVIFPVAFGLIALRFAISGCRNGAMAIKGSAQ